MNEPAIFNNIIINIPLFEDFFIVGFVSVGKLIRLSLHLGSLLGKLLRLFLGKFKAIDESSITDDIIIGVIDILNFFIIGLISVGEFIGFSLHENNSLRCFYSLKRCDLRS